MPNSEFHFKQFSILHQKEGLKVTTDACILGAFAKNENTKNILDIGTGTGVIALMLAQKYPEANVSAIDIQAVVVKQAKLNIEQSKFKDRINLHHGDIKTYNFDSQFDLIVCNPPYFTTHLVNSNKQKHIALHNDTLSKKDLYKAVIQHLNPNGLFWVIFPPFEFQQFENLACGITLIEKIKIYNQPHKLHRIIGCFTLSTSKEILEKNLILCNEQNQRTEEFNKLMCEYYL